VRGENYPLRKPPIASVQKNPYFRWRSDLVTEMLARSGENNVWLGRTAGLHCIIEGVIQAKAAEAARDN
jgi:hypothetical protein